MKMRATSRLIAAVMFSLVVLVASLYTPIIPCKTAPQVPNPQYKWGFCAQNPDSSSSLDKQYFAYTPSFTESYIITLILSFVLAFLVLSIFLRRGKD